MLVGRGVYISYINHYHVQGRPTADIGLAGLHVGPYYTSSCLHLGAGPNIFEDQKRQVLANKVGTVNGS